MSGLLHGREFPDIEEQRQKVQVETRRARRHQSVRKQGDRRQWATRMPCLHLAEMRTVLLNSFELSMQVAEGSAVRSVMTT